MFFLSFENQSWYPVQSSLRLYSDESQNGIKLCNLHRKVMTDRISGGWILAVGWLMGWKAWPLLSPTAEGVSLVTHTRNQYFHKGLLALQSTGTHSGPMAKIITRGFFPHSSAPFLLPLHFPCSQHVLGVFLGSAEHLQEQFEYKLYCTSPESWVSSVFWLWVPKFAKL